MSLKTIANNKVHAALAIDRYWAIDSRFAESMLGAMSETPADAAVGMSAPITSGDYFENGDFVIRMSGVMMKAESSFGSSCSTVRIRRLVRQAANDPRVDRIILVMDSPGGSVFGTADLADDVRKAAEIKPVVAYIEDMCCSAAYWVASQCTEIVASPNALAIGSIGVYTVLYDLSEAYSEAGILPILVSSGGLKGKPVSGLEIEEDVIEDHQNCILQIYDQFIGAVCAGRGIEAAELLPLADGRTYSAEEAMGSSLVDRLAVWDDVLSSDEPEKTPALAQAGKSEMDILKRFNAVFRGNEAAGSEPPAAPAIQDAILANAITAEVKQRVNVLIDNGALTAATRDKAEAAMIAAIQSENVEVSADGTFTFGPAFEALSAFMSELPKSTLAERTLQSVDGRSVKALVESEPGRSEKSSYRKSYEAGKEGKKA